MPVTSRPSAYDPDGRNECCVCGQRFRTNTESMDHERACIRASLERRKKEKAE